MSPRTARKKKASGKRTSGKTGKRPVRPSKPGGSGKPAKPAKKPKGRGRAKRRPDPELPLFDAGPPVGSPASELADPDEKKTAAGRTPTPRAPRNHQTAQSIALRQREISISEFFAKNRHLLGFDSLPKALLTTVKEAVDNSLDACEEAGVLPEIVVEIGEIAENRYRLIVEDSGPGIVKSQIPKIFGKLLYGSKFHVLKQSRGQQGIGISAAVMYAQLTTGKPVRVTSRTGPRQKAHAYELHIDTKKNAPVIVSDSTVDWERPHGTRIEMEILAAYKKGQRSVDAYLHQVAMANPHARIIYRSPRNPEVVYEALADVLPDEPKEIKPHPHGVELGVLLDMLKVTRSRNIKGFLESEFSRMSPKTSKEALERAAIKPSTSPKRVSREQTEALIRAFGEVRIMKPPTNCLSPIGEQLILRSLERERDADFFSAVTRPPAVYRGNPFQIEAGVAYGGSTSDQDESARIFRFANRAPLIYQQSACAITQSVIGTGWKGYGIGQARGALPTGPLLIMVHIASAWVPFTSESKEAIAHYPEIIKEIKLALQECGRRLARFIRKGARAREEAKKRSYIEQYIPHIGIALQEILRFSETEEQRIVDRLKLTLERSRKH